MDDYQINLGITSDGFSYEVFAPENNGLPLGVFFAKKARNERFILSSKIEGKAYSHGVVFGQDRADYFLKSFAREISIKHFQGELERLASRQD